ncbi:MAG: GNAT family N-acetyltransferase [Candidatus Aminicenantes bacterium]|nr:GNAT family N-acetyltransferase [Candidatus Aminicenantes bacterium]
MAVEIREVKNKRELKRFVRFPFILYKDNKYWVPPLTKNEMELLNSEKNPDFEYCEAKYWLAYKDNLLVGRIAGIYNKKYIEKWKNKYASFSRFDFIDDEDVSRALFDSVEVWAKSKGMEGVHGPLGFTTFDHQAVLTEGFDEMPTSASVYNYEYYPKHLDKLGCKKEVDYIEFKINVPKQIPEKAARIANIVLKREKLKLIKSKSKRKLFSYSKQLFHVINESYKPLFYFIELNDKQMNRFIKKYTSLVKAKYILLVVNEENKVIAFQITMPSLSTAFQKARGRLFPFGFIYFLMAARKPNVLDLYLIGILPEYQGKGIQALFMKDLNQTAIDNNIQYGESNSELEENTKVQSIWKYYDSTQHKRKRIYVKRI